MQLPRRVHRAVLITAAVCSLIGGLAAQRAAAPLSGDPAQTPPVEGTGAISGVVVDGVSGRPLPGAIVILTNTGDPRGGSSIPRVATDDRGRFIFDKLVAGNYLVNVAKIGYFESRNPQRIALGDGRWISESKTTLWKYGAISGVVTDEANEPVVGVFVRVLTQVLIAGMPQVAGGTIARTDDRGAYRIPGLPPGKYIVLVPSVQSSVPADTTQDTLNGVAPTAAANVDRPPRNDRTLSPDGKNLLFLGTFVAPPPVSNRSLAYPMTFYPAARLLRDAVTVELKNGEERSGIDVQLRPVPVVTVSGTITAPADAEAAGIILRLRPAGMEGLGNGSETATALVAADGSFTFLNVPMGEYTLIASRALMEYGVNRLNAPVAPIDMPSPPGWIGGNAGGGVIASASTGTDYAYQVGRGSLTYSARQPLTVGDRDVTGLIVTLTRAVTLSGRVVSDVESATTSGRPLSIIYAEPADGNAALGMLSGRFETDGSFSISGLQSGAYTLRFLSGSRIKSITYDGKDYTYRPFDASAGHDISGVVITTTSQTTRLTGFVREGSSSATHGRVILFPSESEQWTRYGFSPRRLLSVSVSTAGAYSALTLPAGEYLAIAVDDSLATAWQDSKFLAAAAPLATRVSLEWGDSKIVDLTTQQVPGFKPSGGF